MGKEKKMTKRELIACIGGIVTLITICFTVYFWFEGRYAHAGDMVRAMETIKKIEIRLDYKIIEDQLRSVQQRIYTVEDRYCHDKSKPCTEANMPQTVAEEYRELKCEKERLQKELDELRKAKK
jgi:hypothetical protein